ncbi:MAG TPA: 6,7-dimethyl-8-ribityllumazine synthase [Ignavibacteriales bacterium]|nr:6,7-dimethyl-8-ribityllumazine synthase [Ignavibacteriales bacterium]
MKPIEGKLIGTGKKFAIIQSKFNDFIGEGLLKAANDCLLKHGVNENNIDIIKVPGAFELASTADRLAAKKKYDAIICLGVIIRGATPHFDFVASAASNGISLVSQKHSLPVIFGVLTTDTIEQAIERAGTKSGNKGWDCALAALEMADLFKLI